MVDTHWSLKQTTAPTAEPLTREEGKPHCRIDADLTDEDALLDIYIAAARDRAEQRTGRQLMPATWKLYLDCFPSWIIRLPRPPLVSVTSITYVDTSGVTQTLSSSLYEVDTASEPGRIVPAYGQSWPATRGEMNDVIVTYEAGYGETVAAARGAMPANLKLGMLHYVAQWFRQREPVNVDNIINELPMAGDAL